MNSRIFRLLISISIGLLSCISIFAFVRSASDHNQVANFVSPTQAYNNVVQTIAHKPVIIQSTAIPEIMNLPGNPSIVNTTGMVAGNNINTSQEQNTISRPAQTIKSISSNSISTISQDVSTALSNGFKEQINSEEAVSNLPPIMLPQTSASDLLTVTAPTTASIIGPSNGFINESQHFTAVSEPNTATAPLSYNWQTIEHGNIHHFNGITDTIDLSWSQVGTHRITVTVSNGNGTISDVFTTTILDKLISGLNAISNSPTPLGSTTQFTATALTGTNIHYIWDFGDASSGSGSSVIHKYTTTGIFSVTLRAENSAGVYTKTLLSQVKILPAVTLSNFSTNEGALYVTAGSFTDPDSAVWTGTVYFGDGSNLQNLTINPNKTFTLTHSYLDSGLFNVNVQIVDEIGGKGIVTVTATIANLAPTANLTSTIQVNEGSPAIMAFNNQYDPSSVDTSAGFFYSYDFNNDWIYEITASVHPSATIPSYSRNHLHHACWHQSHQRY